MTEAPPVGGPEAEPGEDAPAPPPTSLRDRLVPPMPGDRVWGWVAPLLVTALAGVLRFWDLGKPKAIAFDETYYAKDAWSLLKYGYERTWLPTANDQILAGKGTGTGNDAVLKVNPEYVVHPPVGKWVIAGGEQLFGLTPFGWRFSVALLGTISVLVLCRVARRMFRSTLLGCVAGIVLAVDGLALVMNRTALLDGVLAAFLLFAFGCLVVDRDRGRARIAAAVDRGRPVLTPSGRPQIGERIGGLGPRLLRRPWRVAAGVFLGLALGTKWNALFFVVAFVVMVAFWDMGTRKAIGVRFYRSASVRRDLLLTVLTLVALPVVVYVATWTGWIAHWGDPSGYYRNWAAARGPATLPLLGVHVPLVPDWFRSLWHYHHEAYVFHKNLDSPHPYQSNPWGWLLLARPVAVYYVSVKSGPSCPSGNCSSAITALGNPLVWWVGILAIAHSAWRWVGRRDWRGGAVVAGVAAGLLPWFMYQQRTVFSFYAVVLVPFIALAIAQLGAAVLGGPGASPNRRTLGSVVLALYVAATVLTTAFFWPVLTGEVIPYADWLRRMWFKSWI